MVCGLGVLFTIVPEVGLNEHVAPVGRPEQLYVMVSRNGPEAVLIVMFVTVNCPGSAVGGSSTEPENEKSCSLTTCVSTEDLLPALFWSPAYTAVMEWLPADKPDVVKVVVAESGTPLHRQPRNPDPIVVLPSLKFTVPVGVKVPVAVTVAVKVTESPKLEGFSLDVTAVVVDGSVTEAQLASRFPTLIEPRPVTSSKPAVTR